MRSIILFASGKGSNAAAIIDHFRNNNEVAIALIVSNKATAGVLEIAASEGIPSRVIDKAAFTDKTFLQEIEAHQPALIVLAGFLWKIPDWMVAAFSNRIINIHPALLPLYGGKGMYGHHVHNAVLLAAEQQSGITVHYVNEVYDSGNVILQARCEVLPADTADSLASRIHELEHYYYPRVIEFLLSEIDKH
ncbi:MAG: phosphoribosylglycinamide formyltransferase [Taibaiella sp.]|nr:phosphoribosylglycinamide formyltransferase [Taibaiella sp.]